jgi:hypothetical protein
MKGEGDFLRKWLADLDLNQVQFAKLLGGMSERGVRKWLDADELPGGAYEKIGDALKIPWMIVRGAMRGSFDMPPEYRDSAELDRRLAFPEDALPPIPGKTVRSAAKKGNK